LIDRKKLLKRNNPILKACDFHSPLTVGNGEFAFTADITGLQTLRKEYTEKGVPLCTMSQWGWHETPNHNGEYYGQEDLQQTYYQMDGKTVAYPVEMQEGNEDVYTWLRENPHRMNLYNIGFRLDNQSIHSAELAETHQELCLYDGLLKSQFQLANQKVHVETFVAANEDTVSVTVASTLLLESRLQLVLEFPYPSPEISGADWEKEDQHQTELERVNDYEWVLKRQVDQVQYATHLTSNCRLEIHQEKQHQFVLQPDESDSWDLAITYATSDRLLSEGPTELEQQTVQKWHQYWDSVGLVDFAGSQDMRAAELERRLILSQYLTAIQCSGTLPPQETGLICNSWYGKFHLEMHIWHSGYMPLWNKPELLENSFAWYKSIQPKGKENAQKNGFAGLRWPKMIGPEGIDSPSIIAPLLIWQQPHILYMLELVYQTKENREFLTEYWEMVKGTADFMADFVKWDEEDRRYHLIGPLIPAQEEFDPVTVKNPTFELEYWRFGLNIALGWAERLGKQPDTKWQHVYDYLAESPIADEKYLSHENCPDTFESFNKDHPSMLTALGFIASDRINHQVMENTLRKVMDSWEFETLWGWDFAVMAMCATRLGDPELAIDLLLMDSPKNQYVVNGNNYQMLREDLPVYLPGNGSLLLAIGLMVAGWGEGQMPGIPQNGKWQVQFENIFPFPA